MLTIVPADEATTRRCQAEAGREGECLAMTEGNEWQGFCLYTKSEDLLTVHTLATEEELLAEGLIRAAVNIARNRAIPVAICEDERYPVMLARLGFVKNETGWQVEVADFFKPCCGCRHEMEGAHD